MKKDKIIELLTAVRYTTNDIEKVADEICSLFNVVGQRNAKLQSDKETLLEALKITTELAEWSERYPRGRTYPISKINMDDELIAIEEKAKKFIAITKSTNH
jgi:hypothetical protein